MEELAKQWLVIVFDKIFLGGAIALVTLFVARRIESSKLLKQLLIETRAQRVSIKSQLSLEQLPVFMQNSRRLMKLVSDYNPRVRPSPDQYKEIYEIETELYVAVEVVVAISSTMSKKDLLSLHQVAITIDKELFTMGLHLNQQDEHSLLVEWNKKSTQLLSNIRDATKSTIDAMQKIISDAVNVDFSVISDLRSAG